MELIKAINLSLHNGSKDILTNAGFRILEGQKYGLIGANGCGKTTLIRLILGETEADRGTLQLKPGLKIGTVPQEPRYKESQTIEAFLLEELSLILDRMKSLELRMSGPECTEDSAVMEAVLKEYQESCDKFESAGGYNSLERGETVIRRLGLDNPLSQTLASLSGGERSLIFFAKALLGQPELLILDEPGNHLDYLGLAWLESFLASYPGAVLIVSHNRYLLEKTCPTLLDLRDGILSEFRGSYSAYRREKYRTALIEQSAWEAGKKRQEKLEKRIKELQSIAMSQYNPPASVMSQLAAAKTKLSEEKKLNLKNPSLENDPLRLDFGSEQSRSHIALEVKDFNWNYGDKVLFQKGNLEIRSREKVALVGANGCGKSTFLKAVLDQAEWENKNMRIGPSQRVGYLSQTPVFGRTALSIEDEIRSWGPLTRDGAFTIAGKFSFSYQDLDKPLSVLSGGEAGRLQLARLMYEKTNFLILDEPTNHMDIQSREIIEQAISRFQGTLLVVSHDRYFLDQLVDRVIEISDRSFHSYEGNFSEYFRTKYPVLPRLSGKIERRASERRREKRETPRDTALLERRIQEAEDEKSRLESVLSGYYEKKDRQKGLKTALELEKLSSRLEKMYSEWEEEDS